MKVPSIEPLEARIAPAVLTISPVSSSTDEGSTVGSTTNVQFKITLDTIEAQDITVLATAFAGTALVGEDFAAFSQTIIIPKGSTEFIFNVPIKQDKTVEGDETFSVKLSSPSANAFLGPEGTETAIGTIKNDDKPTLTLEPVTGVFEGSVNGQLTQMTFKIKLDQKSATEITLKANPENGTGTGAAIAGEDYVDGDIDITIPAGFDEWTFTVPIFQDMKVEGNETFTVELFGVSDNAFLGTTKKQTATILTDDLPKMSIQDATVVEGAGGTTQMKFKVVLEGEAPEDITFNWFTAGNSATEGVDFSNVTSTTATIPAGTKELELIVNVIGDTTDESDETFSAIISPNSVRMGTETILLKDNDNQAVGKILNDDLSVSLAGPGTVTEQTAGENGPLATIANYSLTLSGTSNHPVTVELEIVDGTAKAGLDFTKPTSLTITIPANSVTPGSSTISVPITIDQIFEGDQTFQVRIKSVTNAIAGEVSEVTTTILDDEVKPTLSVVATTVPEGNEAREVQVTVSLSGKVEGPVTFDWSTLDGTAIAGLDYEAVVNRTATIADGALSTTLVLKLLGDEVWESDEKLSILVSNVSSNVIVAPGGGSAVVTIDEREAVPALKITDVTAAEDAGTMTFVVSMPDNTVASEDITFDWSAGLGTATSGVDYSATPTTVTIPAGQRSATFTITLLDDAVMEADETFLVTIGNATFDRGGSNETAVPITDNQATARIMNDERQVSISTGTLVVEEKNGVQDEVASVVHYVINLTDGNGNPLASDRDVTITLDVDALLGTAEANDVEFPNGRTVTIPAGSTSVGIDVKIRGDVVFEGDETLVMKIADVTNASIRDGSASTTITDEEGPVRFVLEDQKVGEGNIGIVVRKYIVKLNGPAEQDITFDWSMADGTAISGAGLDYTLNPSGGTGKILAGQTEAEIEVVLSGDTADEGDEHFFLNFSNVQMKDGTPVTLDTDAQAKVTIQNDEAVARIAGRTMVEGPGGEMFLVFDVSLSQASQHEVTLTFAVGAEGDTATRGVNGVPDDYELPATMTVVIPAGELHKTISIPLVEDSLSEANETLTVKVTDSENAFVDVGTATGTIVDDDTAPVLSIDSVTMSEGDAGTKTFAFTISMNAASGQDVKVLVTPTAGTATLGTSADFTGQAKLITIPAGQTTAVATFDVSVNGDTIFEDDETFSVVLSNATGATIATDGTGTGTGTITNDDPEPTLTIANVQVNPEGNSGTRVARFTVNLSQASSMPVKFKLATADGIGDYKATAGSDYVSRAQTEFTIAAGVTSMTYDVTVNGDVFWEGNETFLVMLTDADGAVSASGSDNVTATGLIVDDEAAPTLSIADLTVAEGNGTKEIEVVVTMSTLVGRDVTFDWSLIAGSATMGDGPTFDFNKVVDPGQITIPAGQNTAKIKFTVFGDTAAELDETFSVKIENALAGPDEVSIVKDTALVKLQNDEARITITDWTRAEGDDGSTQFEFVVTVDGVIPTEKITVDYTTQDGTARSTGATGIMDFAATSGTLTFLKEGPTSQKIFVTVYGDTNFDSIDQFKVLLTSSTNAQIVDGDATGTILEETTESRPVVSIVASETSETHAENEGATDGNEATPIDKTAFKYTIKMDRYSDETVTVNFATIAGTATAGTDFTAVNKTITFAPEADLTQDVIVDVLNDTLFEAEETFKVELSNPQFATLGAKERTGTIQVDAGTPSNDVMPTLKVSNGTIVEGDDGTRFMEFVVQRTGATGTDLNFTFTPKSVGDDTASAVADYTAVAQTITMTPSETSKVVKVEILPDADVELDETFTVELSNPVGATISGDDGKAKGTILDDDVKVSISPGTYSISEGNAGQTDLVFNVELNQASAFPTTITYTVAPGTATTGGANADYQVPVVLSIVIPEGATTGQIRIPVLGDTTAEPNETFTVTLTGATNAELAATNTTATGTILNDDASLIISDGQIVEGANGETAQMVFTVSLKDATVFPVTVHYTTTNGSAVAGTDYTLTQGDLTFVQGGATELLISVPITGDATQESHETFTITLSNGVGATILDATATGTILDDDNAHLSIGDMSVEEGDNGQQNLIFKVTLSGAHTERVTVDYTTVDGTAKSAGPLLDYLAQNGTLTFEPGEIEKTISIPIIGDIWKELDEQFTVKLSNALYGGRSSGIAIDDDTATGRILDDGDATIGLIVNHGRAAEGSSGATTAMNFTIETTAPATETITLKASTRAGSAGTTDFTGFSGTTAKTITIDAGSSTASVTVNLTGDNVFEDSEFFYLDVSDFGDQVAPVDGSSGRLSAFGVILNDDVKIINSREFEYVDKDGDLVHVKFSKGTLSVPATGAGTSSDDVTFTIDSATGGRTIDLINLADDGREFEGASITITATQQILVTGEILGNSKTQVGSIQSMLVGNGTFDITAGVGLGVVKIDGELGSVLAGSFAKINGIRKLEVDQFGVSGTNVDQAQSVVFGPLGKMIVHGDFLGSMVVSGDTVDRPFPGGIGKIGTLKIEGALQGGKAGTGQIAVTHSIGNATVGSIVGGADASGLIRGVDNAFNVSIGKLTVLGDIVGGAGANSGAVLLVNKLGSLTIGKFGTGSGDLEGNLIGGAGQRSGAIDINTSIGRVSINGDIRGGANTESGLLRAGKINQIRVEGDLTGGAGEKSGLVEANGIGSVSINGDLKGGTAKNSGLVNATTIGSVRVQDIVGGAGEASGRINTIELRSLLVSGDIQGGNGANAGSVNATKSLGSGRVTGNLIGSAGTNSGSLVFGTLRGALNVEGNISGGTGSASGLVSIPGYTQSGVPFAGNAGSITIGKAGVTDSGNIFGGDGDNSGKVFVSGNLRSFLAYGSLNATTVKEEGQEPTTVKGAGVAGLDVGGTLSKAVIKGSLVGGTSDMATTTNRPVGSAFVSAGRIGSLTIEGSVKSGVKDPASSSTQSSAFSAGIHSNTSIDTLKILGELGGNKDVPVVITAGEQIGNVTIGGDVLYAEILAGYNRTTELSKSRGTFYNAGATIESVTVDGTWTASSLVAGFYAGADGKFGTADDNQTSNGTPASGTGSIAVINQDLVSRIAKVIIKQTIEPVPADAPTDASYAIVAEYLKAVQVNGIAEGLTAGASNDLRSADPGASKTQIFEKI